MVSVNGEQGASVSVSVRVVACMSGMDAACSGAWATPLRPGRSRAVAVE